MSIYRNGLGEVQTTQAPPAPAPPAPAKAPYEEFAVYQYSVSLVANQSLLDQGVPIDSDSDFVAAKIVGSKTGDYELNIRLPDGRRICSAMVRDSIVVGVAQFPVPIVPHVYAPAASHIGIDIHDLSGAANDVVIAFIGWRRYPTK